MMLAKKVLGVLGVGVMAAALVAAAAMVVGERHAEAQVVATRTLTMGPSYPYANMPIRSQGVSVAHNGSWNVNVEGSIGATNYNCLLKTGSLSDALALEARIVADKTTNVDCRAPYSTNEDRTKIAVLDLAGNAPFGLNSNP